MSFYERYSVILGLCGMIVVATLLLAPSDLAFSSGVTFIDTELQRSSGNQTYVRTKMDFGNPDHMAAIPMSIGEWEGYEYHSTDVSERIGGHIALARGYTIPWLYQPIDMIILQAETESAFTRPETCFNSYGFSIEEKAREEILVSGIGYPEDSPTISVPFRKLVVTKQDGGEVVDRRVVLYCYVKGNQLTTDAITLIQLEASVPTEGSYEEILTAQRDLIQKTIPMMFEPGKDDAWKPIAMELTEWGAGGYAIIGVLVLLPFAIMIYPRTRRQRHSGGEKQVT